MPGKRYKAATAGYDKMTDHSVAEAVKIVKENAKAKFDETVEVAINLAVDPRHADQMVRGVCNLPNGTGRSVRVAVFAKDAKAEEAKKAGADIVGADDLAAQIQAGDMPFERVIATPDMMPLVGRLGKVLGPKGMMPNPKVGTVTPKVAEAVENAKGGQVRYRADKAGIVHCTVGKANFEPGALKQNLQHLLGDLVKAKPSSTKGVYMRKVVVSTTMGPGLTIDHSGLI